jgi:hypothetical protein
MPTPQVNPAPLEVFPPLETPDSPDADSQTGPTYIPDGAPNQVFRINLKWFSYGTDDKPHAASLLLSLMLGFLLLFVFLIGLFVERIWIPDAIKILGTAFTFTAGVAIGKSSAKR